MTDKLEQILLKHDRAVVEAGKTYDGQVSSVIREEAKQAINELTLKQVMELINKRSDKEYGVSKELFEHSELIRAELRQSAERIWK